MVADSSDPWEKRKNKREKQDGKSRRKGCEDTIGCRSLAATIANGRLRRRRPRLDYAPGVAPGATREPLVSEWSPVSSFAQNILSLQDGILRPLFSEFSCIPLIQSYFNLFIFYLISSHALHALHMSRGSVVREMVSQRLFTNKLVIRAIWIFSSQCDESIIVQRIPVLFECLNC